MTGVILGFSITAIISGIILELVPAILEGGLKDLSYTVSKLPEAVFFIEQAMMPGRQSDFPIQKVILRLYGMMGGLAALRFVWSGFKTYILCINGDPDQPPTEMLKGIALAIISTAIFPYLYKFGYDVVVGIMNSVLLAFGINRNDAQYRLGTLVVNAVENIDVSILGLIDQIVVCAYLVCFLLLVLKLLVRGCEMLIYRMGIPLAATGLVQPDGGGWWDYIGILVRMYICTLIQIFCMYFSAIIIKEAHLGTNSDFIKLIGAFAFLLLGINTPALLNQWMPASRSSGGGRLISTTMQASGSAVRAAGGAGRWVSSIFTRR